MSGYDGKELTNAWTVACATADHAGAIRILIRDYGYTRKAAGSVLQIALDRYNDGYPPATWRSR